MSIVVFVESDKGTFKKNAFEAVTFARQIGEQTGLPVIALCPSSASNPEELGEYGIGMVKRLNNFSDNLDVKNHAKIFAEVLESLQAEYFIMSHTSLAKNLAAYLTVKWDAELVSEVQSWKGTDNLHFRKMVFAGKAAADIEITGSKKVITVSGNAIPPEKHAAEVSVEDIQVPEKESKISFLEVQRQTGSVPLPEAERVVSGGRGFKGPENWGILEELASTLDAATACSRPVADSHWRPHHEHVGQTGVTVRPNLYIAIGISGAIQHLGGVNNSKVIVVINKDPEAPFFKAADYGVCADLFDVVPKLTQAVKDFNEKNS